MYLIICLRLKKLCLDKIHIFIMIIGIKLVSNNQHIDMNNLMYSTDGRLNLHNNEIILDNTLTYKSGTTRDRKFRLQIPNDNILCNKIFEKIYVSTNTDNTQIYINFTDNKNHTPAQIDMINTPFKQNIINTIYLKLNQIQIMILTILKLKMKQIMKIY